MACSAPIVSLCRSLSSQDMSHLNYDSILTAVDSNAINSSAYFAVGDTLPARDIAMAPCSYLVATDDYVQWGLLTMFGVMAIVMYRFRTSMFHLLKGFFATERKFSEHGINDKALWAVSVFALISITALSLSLTVFDGLTLRYQFSEVLGIPYWLLSVFYALFMLYVYGKACIYAVVNWTFFDKETSASWMSGYMLLTALTAFLVYPISLLQLFSTISQEFAISCYLFIVVLYEMLLVFKLFVNFRIKKYGILLIFLYFCSVELIPALVLWHIMGRASDVFIEANVLY